MEAADTLRKSAEVSLLNTQAQCQTQKAALDAARCEMDAAAAEVRNLQLMCET